MNQVKHRFASHTYATRSCLLTVVAIRFQVPIDNSVQGMMVTAGSRGNRVRSPCIHLQAKKRRLTFSLMNQIVQTCIEPRAQFRWRVWGQVQYATALVFSVL